MKPKIQCFFMLLMAVLFCLSGCGKKEEEMTFGPQGTAQTDTGSGANVRVEAGQNCFYYESSDGILYAVPAGTRVKERLGAGKLLGADEQYAYIWRENRLQALEGNVPAAEIECFAAPYYCATLDDCAYFTDSANRLYYFTRSKPEWRLEEPGCNIGAMAKEGDRLYYIRYAEDPAYLQLCGYDLKLGQEQVLSEFNNDVVGRFDVACVDGRLYYYMKDTFYSYDLATNTQEELIRFADNPNTSAIYWDHLAYIWHQEEEVRRLWIYDMREAQPVSDEITEKTFYGNAFGLTFYQDGAGWFGEEEARAVFDERFAATLHGLSGSPAGIIAHSWPGEIMIAFKQPDGSYDVQFTEQLFDR